MSVIFWQPPTESEQRMSIRSTGRRSRLGAILSGVLVAASVVVLSANPAAAAGASGGVGATLPYVEVQAENSLTNGTLIGPSAAYGTLAGEASRRQAVTLQGTGKYVEFTTPVATNSIDFRYSIPDTSSGSVYTAPLSMYVNGTKQSDFTLTNA
ncbi:MAG: coagulation factor 5/8 type domain protein, partial [Actinomycetia bacterium]|nr:coagulation factor 5/8 type domain protein [Actinomycetes bacterium]